MHLLLHAVLATGVLCLYVIYYVIFCVDRPRVVCSDARRMRALRKHCPALFERYWPTIWSPQGYMQTIVRMLIQIAPRLGKGRREKVCMSDGGHVCLDWFNERGSAPDCSSEGAEAIILMLPGTTGSSDDPLIQHLIDDVNHLGYRSVVFTYRGCGNTKISTPRLYSVGDVSDLTEVVEHIHSTHLSSTIIAVGLSFGCVQLIRYVALCKRQGRPCHFTAAFNISVVWSLMDNDKVLHSNFFNKYVLSRYLALRFIGIMEENRTVFEEAQKKGELSFDFETALKSRNLQELNRSCVVHMFKNYKDPNQQSSSPCETVHDLSIPMIAVGALDDPFSPADRIPVEIAWENPNLVLATTRKGGHAGFMQGLLPFRKTYINTVFVQFLRAVLQHKCFEDAALYDFDQDT